MKKILIAIILFLALFYSAFADEERDFGLRINLGGISGIGDETQYEAEIGTDFYFLSEDFRMTFGTTFIFSQSDYFPLTAIHFLGLEYNVPLHKNHLFVGFNYNKSYLQQKKNGLSGRKGWSYYLGYKYSMTKYLDIVLVMGTIQQPYVRSTPDPNFPLKENSTFMRIGTEWYF